MRVLVLGGSWLLGRLVVEESHRRGCEVTVFNRGRSATVAPAGVRQVRGDRANDDDLRMLARSGSWDAVIDISGKAPALVRRTVRMLSDVAQRYVSVSTVSVYRDWPHAPVDEDSPLRDGDPDFDPGAGPWDPDTYSRMKVGCELAGREAFGDDRVLILRLHTMLGQHEDAGPLLWWLNRACRGGQVLVPGPDRAIQPVDVHDVCRFLVDQVERGGYGAFNVGAPPEGRTFGGLVRACAAAVAADACAATELVWVDGDWLAESGVRPAELPLWSRAPATWEVAVARAARAGLRCRPLADTVAATWRWWTSRPRPVDNRRLTGFGLDPARESAILARWRESRSHGQRPGPSIAAHVQCRHGG